MTDVETANLELPQDVNIHEAHRIAACELIGALNNDRNRMWGSVC